MTKMKRSSQPLNTSLFITIVSLLGIFIFLVNNWNNSHFPDFEFPPPSDLEKPSTSSSSSDVSSGVEQNSWWKNPSCSKDSNRFEGSWNNNHRFLQCLQKDASQKTALAYPSDAESHFLTIHRALKEWLQGSPRHRRPHRYRRYKGPWIENHWINHFFHATNLSAAVDDDDDGSTTKEDHGFCLAEIFGPFIPLFIPWVDTFVNYEQNYTHVLDTVASLLRDNVPYVAVTQSDYGLELLAVKPNILALSAGGYGHVPIPLLIREQKINNMRPADERKYVFNYVGDLGHSPRGMRQEMHDKLEYWGNHSSIASLPKDKILYKYYKGTDWVQEMADSLFSFAPRGFGRTSFHLMESLQMGLIPVHVYSDRPWIPYEPLLVHVEEPVVYTSNTSGLEALVQQLVSLSPSEIQRKEERILRLRETHFVAPGIMSQIENLLIDNDEETDLVCHSLPASPRDDE